MANPAKSAALDKWREFFRTANSDIFCVIEQAIIVAASDCPKEFKIKRDKIAETLFTCTLTNCLGRNRVGLSVPVHEDEEEEEGCENGFEEGGCKLETLGSRGTGVNISVGDDHGGEVNGNKTSSFSYKEAEALTDEIEEESQIIGEVLRIKEIIDSSEEQSDSALFESLRRLQLMALSVETLKATEIGKSVNFLRKHASKGIRNLARLLIEEWKNMVDEWVIATAATASEATPESLNPSTVEEEGLPSPPLDDLAFFVTQPTSMELSGFFDGMDDDGNPRNGGSMKNANEIRRNPPKGPTTPLNGKNEEPVKKQGGALTKKPSTATEPSKPPAAKSAPERPVKPSTERNVCHVPKLHKTSQNAKSQPPQADKSKCADEAAVLVKLEATKRKLQESYQLAENAKRQRTIQVMELHDLPKQSLGHMNNQSKPGNKAWARSRR